MRAAVYALGCVMLAILFGTASGFGRAWFLNEVMDQKCHIKVEIVEGDLVRFTEVCP